MQRSVGFVKVISRMLALLLACALLGSLVSAQAQASQQKFVLTFVGDCTLGSMPSQYNAGLGLVKTVGTDYGYPFRNVIDYFTGDDGTFANLEGPLTDQGNPVEKTYVFHGPTEFVNILTENSVDFVSLANNHSLDYGQIGYDSTRTLLTQVGIPFVERDSSVLLTLEGGLKVGVYGMVYYLLDVKDMTAEIASLREQGAELVIVAPHWGYEGSYQANAEQIQVAHASIDTGADIVWGSHPHVLQPVEEYGDGVIFYSLGNFCFGGNGCPDDFDTAVLQQEVLRDADGNVTLGELKIVPCSISSATGWNNFQPTPLEPGTKEYDRVLTKLGQN